jgi:hypothetical protein
MMRATIIAVLAYAALSVLVEVSADEGKEKAKDEAGDRAQVTKFFKDHVLGKTVVTPKTTFQLDDKKMEGDYQDLTTYNNFAETAQGFSFDLTVVSKEMRYDLDKDGKRIVPGRDYGGTEVYRYEICERASTKKLTGTARPVSSTINAPSREGTVILVTGVKIGDGKLVWNETLPGYADFIAPKGKYKPCTWDSKYTLSVVEGKLWVEYQETNRYDVDPDTLKRTPTKDKLPLFVAKESDQK